MASAQRRIVSAWFYIHPSWLQKSNVPVIHIALFVGLCKSFATRMRIWFHDPRSCRIWCHPKPRSHATKQTNKISQAMNFTSILLSLSYCRREVNVTTLILQNLGLSWITLYSISHGNQPPILLRPMLVPLLHLLRLALRRQISGARVPPSFGLGQSLEAGAPRRGGES